MASGDFGQAHNVSCTEQLIFMIYLRAFGRWPWPANGAGKRSRGEETCWEGATLTLFSIYAQFVDAG